MKRTILLVLCIAGILVMDACTIRREVIVPTVDPRDPIALSGVIVFTDNTQQFPGNLPTSPGTPACAGANTQILNTPSIKLTNGSSSVFIPISYSGSLPISTVYVKIEGADTYFVIPIATPTAVGTITIPISLPSTVIDGSFSLQIVLAGANGCIAGTTVLTVPVEVGQPLSCNSPSVVGTAGITQTVHNLNRAKGKVIIKFDNRNAPDRIDVYLDGRWVGGTGSSTTPPPPTSSCNGAKSGFVSGTGTITIDVAATNQQVQVYVSGCTGAYTENGYNISGTQWDYTLSCQ